MDVFVHLAAGQSAEEWTQRWSAGTLIGINEPKPYGYHRAEAEGCRVVFSRSHSESLAQRTLRLGLRAALGFDVVHAWRNRDAMLSSDVVWTHTEAQHMGALAVLRALEYLKRNPKSRPALIAQCVWLFDNLTSTLDPRSLLWRRLMKHADVITVLSRENLDVARSVFPGNRSEFVPFGIRVDEMRPVRRRSRGRPLHILAVGNDRHRDWSTLVAAVTGLEVGEVRIVSQTAPRSIVRGNPYVQLVRASRNEELDALYDWADVAVVPLKPNLHASGITVILEALVRGLPVIASDTGGLRAYFDAEELSYAEARDPRALREQLERFAREPEAGYAKTLRAQAKLRNGKLNSAAYVRRHVELSRELLRRAVQKPAATPKPSAARPRVQEFQNPPTPGA